jgi:tRNA threonylcarbamoyladenosine biosynthesis protein TsaE
VQFEPKSPEETLMLAERLGAFLRPGDVLGLIGSLGTGKTTFVRGLALGLGISPEYEVTSPTFVYAHVYDGGIPLTHIDLYRIENGKHLAETGIEEMLGSDGVAVIEWFDLFPQIWTGDRIEIRFEMLGDRERRIRAEGFGERGGSLAALWGSAP